MTKKTQQHKVHRTITLIMLRRWTIPSRRLSSNRFSCPGSALPCLPRVVSLMLFVLNCFYQNSRFSSLSSHVSPRPMSSCLIATAPSLPCLGLFASPDSALAHSPVSLNRSGSSICLIRAVCCVFSFGFSFAKIIFNSSNQTHTHITLKDQPEATLRREVHTHTLSCPLYCAVL